MDLNLLIVENPILSLSFASSFLVEMPQQISHILLCKANMLFETRIEGLEWYVFVQNIVLIQWNEIQGIPPPPNRVS